MTAFPPLIGIDTALQAFETGAAAALAGTTVKELAQRADGGQGAP